MLHHIQRSILDILSTAQSSRYSDVKPDDIDGNIFTYHLRQLISQQLITKNEDGSYALTEKGKNYIVHRYENPLLQAHSIFLIVIKKDNKWLLRERLVQPLLGMSGFIHGEPLANKPLLQTAAHRLQEKTGLNVPLAIHSSGLIRIMRGEVCESFSHAIIIFGETNEDASIDTDNTGRQLWVTEDELSSTTILPSCSDLIERIKKDNRSTFDLTYSLPAVN